MEWQYIYLNANTFDKACNISRLQVGIAEHQVILQEVDICAAGIKGEPPINRTWKLQDVTAISFAF